MHILLTLLSTVLISSSEAEMKVGFVDVAKALQTTKAGIAAKNKLEKEIKKVKDDIKKEEASLKKESEDLKRKETVLSRDIFMQQQAALQRKFVALQNKLAQSQMNIQKREQELTKPILDRILNIANEIGTKKGYDLILQKNEVSVLWGKSSLDLTQEVIKKIDGKK